MKYDNLASFQRHVENTFKSGQWPPVYLFLSADTGISRWMMDWMSKFFKGYEFSSSVADLTPSLFNKEIVVKLELEEVGSEVESFLNHPLKGCVLLLALPKLEASNPFYKKVEKSGVVLQAGQMKPWEKESFFIDYLMRKASHEKVVVANDAAKAIVARSSCDPFMIDSSFEKLSLWKAADGRITLADVNTLGPFNEEETLFHFTDALFLRKGGAAQEIGLKLLEQGSAPLALLKTFRTQCALLYELKNAQLGRLTIEEATSKHAYLRGNILEQKLSQARGFSLDQLKGLLLKVDELERFFKNSGATDEVFLEYAVVSLLQ